MRFPNWLTRQKKSLDPRPAQAVPAVFEELEPRLLLAAADLTIAELVLPGAAEAGQEIDVSITVKNLGGHENLVGTYKTQFYISEDEEITSDDSPLGNPVTRFDTPLDPANPEADWPDLEDPWTQQVTLPEGLSGPYFIGAFVDSNHQITEGNENNNTASDAILLSSTPSQQPDLIVTVTNHGAGVYSPGDWIEASGWKQNIGDAAAPPTFYIEVALSTDNQWDAGDIPLLWLTEEDEGLVAGERYPSSGSVTESIQIPADTPSGSYYFLAMIDSTEVVEESNEANNVWASASADIIIVDDDPKPDLIVGIDSYQAGTYSPGDWITGSGWEENIGDAFAPPTFYIHLALSTDDQWDAGDTEFVWLTEDEGLAAGERISDGGAAQIPADMPSGNYYLLAMIDSTEVVDEGDNEGNNIWASASADIIITTLTWQVAGTGDFDNEGYVNDILWWNKNSGVLGAWLDGQRTGWKYMGTVSYADWEIGGVGDFDNDNYVDDILFRNKNNGVLGAWLMTNGQFTGWKYMGSVSYSDWEIGGVGNFDNDNYVDDILWRNKNNGTLGAWLMTNGQKTGWQYMGSVSYTDWEIVGVGNSDIVWRNKTTGLVGAWLMTNGQRTGWRYIGTASYGTWSSGGLGDLDGNGYLDILWHNQTNGVFGAWLLSNLQSSGGPMIGWHGMGTVS